MPRPMKTFFYLFCLCTFLWTLPCISPAQSPINNDIIEKVQTELEKQHGQSETERIRKGVSQLARNWRSGDGTEQEFADFCLRYFMSGNTLHSNFRRIIDNLTYMEGMLYKISTLFTNRIIIRIPLNSRPTTTCNVSSPVLTITLQNSPIMYNSIFPITPLQRNNGIAGNGPGKNGPWFASVTLMLFGTTDFLQIRLRKKPTISSAIWSIIFSA